MTHKGLKGALEIVSREFGTKWDWAFVGAVVHKSFQKRFRVLVCVIGQCINRFLKVAHVHHVRGAPARAKNKFLKYPFKRLKIDWYGFKTLFGVSTKIFRALGDP